VARFYFNLRHGAYLFSDPIGADYAGLAAARKGASEAARDLILDHPLESDWSRCRFEITDGQGDLVGVIQFSELAGPSHKPRPQLRCLSAPALAV
jgi:hypothetical protein